MKPRRLAVIALAAAAAVLAVPLAGPTSAGSAAQEHEARGHEAQEHEGGTKLEKIMEGIRDTMKRLGKEIDGKDQAAAWKSVCTLQRHLLDAKQEIPAKAAEVDEDERAEFVGAYRARISEMLKVSCEIEAAVLAGKLEKGGRVLKDVMWRMQRPAHKQFRND